MTKDKKKQSDKPLDKMTVKELREIAKEIPDLTGVHGMKKDELLVAIKATQGTEEDQPETPSETPAPAPSAKKKGPKKKEKTPLTVKEIKGLIKNYKTKRQQALSDKDRKMATVYKRRISRLKKKSRKAA